MSFTNGLVAFLLYFFEKSGQVDRVKVFYLTKFKFVKLFTRSVDAKLNRTQTSQLY